MPLVHQPCPHALVELGDELRQGLHTHDDPLDLPVQPTTPASERAGGGICAGHAGLFYISPLYHYFHFTIEKL